MHSELKYNESANDLVSKKMVLKSKMFDALFGKIDKK